MYVCEQTKFHIPIVCEYEAYCVPSHKMLHMQGNARSTRSQADTSEASTP